MANLADDRTQLARFTEALGRTSAIVAPVAEQQASLFVNLDTTFTAFAAIARPYLQDSISGGPPAEQTAIDELPKQRPFLANSDDLFHELRPGVKALSAAAPDLADAFTVGVPALKRVGPVQQAASSRSSSRWSASPRTRWSRSASRT